MTESEITTGTDATTSSDRITAVFQQDWGNSRSTLETWLADIFTTFGLPVPDSLSDSTDHDQGAVDTDEPSETGSDGAVWDTDSDTETTDDSGTDDTIESSEETSDTTDGPSDSDESETTDTNESADSGSDAGDTTTDETNEQLADDTTDSSQTDESETDDGTDADTTTGDRDGEQAETTTDEQTSDTTPSEQTSETTNGFDRAAVERGIHRAVNDERATRGLNELAFDTELSDIARNHSQDMAERRYFSHTDPEGNTFSDRYADAGYTCRVDGSGGTYYIGGENIAQTWYDTPVRTDGGTSTYTTEAELADAIVTQWMNSPGHRENILAPQWEHEGIGVYVTEDGKVYATQNFC